MSASNTRLCLWLRQLNQTREVGSNLRERLWVEIASTLRRIDLMAKLSRFPNGIKISELSSVLRNNKDASDV